MNSTDAFQVGILTGMYEFDVNSGEILPFMKDIIDEANMRTNSQRSGNITAMISKSELVEFVMGKMLVEVANGRATANAKLENEMLVSERISFNEWKALPPSALVYLPKNSEEFLTKRDFTALCIGDSSSNLKFDPESIARRAFLLLLQCEWQHPATIIDEAGGLDELFGADYLEDLPLPSVKSQIFMKEGVGEVSEINPKDRTICIKPVHIQEIKNTVSGRVSFDDIPYTVRAPLNGMYPQRDTPLPAC